MLSRRQSWMVWLAAFALYALTCSRTVQGGDAGELMTLAAIGGVAHPPGYPVVTWLMRAAVALLPVGSVALRASLVSALLAATAVALLHAALRRRTGSTLAGLVAAGALGLSPLFWRYATVAEVFSGAALTAAWLLWLEARIARGWRGSWPALLLGLIAASGVANHHTAILLLPLGLHALWQLCRDEPAPRRARLIGLVVLGVLPGLLSYGLLLVDQGGLRWGDVASVGDLWHHLLRRDYGTLSLAHGGEAVAWWVHPARLFARLPADLGYVFALLALLGLGVGLRARASRSHWTAALLSWLLAGPLLASRFNLPAAGETGAMTERFFILPGVLVAAAAGQGAAWLLDRWPRLQRPSTALVLAAALGALGLSHLPASSHARSTVVEDVARHALAVVAPGAVIVGSGDTMMGAVLYLQEVQGLRPDVTFVYPGVLPATWYRRWLAARHPAPGLDALAGSPPVHELVQRWQGVRPVYLTHGWAAALEVAPHLVEAWVVGEVLVRVHARPDPADLSPGQAAVPNDDPSALAATCPAFAVDPAALAELPRRFEAWPLEQCAWGAQDRARRAMLVGDAEGAAQASARARSLAPWLFAP